MRRRPHRLLLPALLSGLGAGIFFAPQPAAAQEVVDPPVYRSSKPYASDVEAANPEPAPFFITGGLDLRDKYFFRGYVRASSGVVLQPYFTANYTIFEDDHLRITPHAGAFFSLTEDKGPETPKHWNEFRGDLGVAFECQDFTFDVQWLLITSPSEEFRRSEEIGIDIHYNDRALWGRSGPIAALNPTVTFFHEYYDKNDGESDAFVGFTLEPELRPFDVAGCPVTVSFPLAFGGSYNGYYYTDEGKTDQAGYWTAGIKAACELPGARGPSGWRVEAEVDYIRLMADSVEFANGGDSDDVMLRVGVVYHR
jgi:hypothetical protein